VTDPREMEFRDTRRDDPARFLRELRELRSQAGLGHVELAARAHYPLDAIKAAEEGPALPDLPVLSAYVRGCGGTVAEWEERWRAVTDSPARPLLTTRGTGWSEAADAGARVGAASFAADEQDSDRVIASLNRVADGMAATSASSPPSGGSADVWTPAARATESNDTWTPAAPADGNTDVWTPAARAASADVWTPAVPADGGRTAADSMAARTAPDTRTEAEAPTAEPAPPSGDTSASANAPTRPREAPAAMRPVATGQTGRPRPSSGSRTAVAVCATVALVLVVALIALFA
jgi:hypothetical protein